MQWARPEWLWLLVLLPPLALRAWWGGIERKRSWQALGLGGRPPAASDPAWLAAIACLVAALAQPRWGRSGRPDLPPGRDLVLAIDVSRSMGAEDAVPDRLGLATTVAEGLVRAFGVEPGRADRVAVVAFAGKGVLRCPLTENLGAVIEALRGLSPAGVSPGGTDLGAAIDAGIDALDDQERGDGRTLILFSDGEDHAGHWPAALGRAAEAGLIIHTVAVGDPERAQPVPSRPRAGPSRDVLTFEGEPVLSRRDDDALRAIAEATGGAFIPLGLATADLGALFRTRIEPIARARRAAQRPSDLGERFGLALLPALGLVLLACLPSRAGRTRSREGVVLALILTAATAGAGHGPGDAPALVARGRAAYDEGRHADALDAFTRATEAAPSSPWPWYGRAAALYQLGRFAEARDDYRRAAEHAAPDLRTRIDYTLGNTLAALGDLEGAVASYESCLSSTAVGAGLDEVRRRAEGNRSFVLERLRRRASPETGPTIPDDRPPDANDDERGREGTPTPAGNPEEARPATAADATPAGPAGPGGAGGTGAAPTRPSSPGGRLDEALDNLRDARRRRLETGPPPPAGRGFKDW